MREKQTDISPSRNVFLRAALSKIGVVTRVVTASFVSAFTAQVLCICLSGSKSARQNGKARRVPWTEARRTTCCRPFERPSERSGGGFEPIAVTLAAVATLPTRDERRRHSTGHAAARRRTNAMQSQSALLACGAGDDNRGTSQRGPCTGLYARRRPRRPPDQAAPPATQRQARRHGNARPLAAILVVSVTHRGR